MFCSDTHTPGREQPPGACGRGRVLAWFAAAALAAMPAAATAQSSVDTLTSGQAVIFQPITLAKSQDLQFGVIVRPRTGSGTVTQPAAGGSRTTSGGVSVVEGSSYGAPQPATFLVTGEGGQSFSIGIDPSTTLNGPGPALTVTLASSAATGTLDNSLGSTGSATFGVGGTIVSIGSTTPTGVYTGAFNVTVTYN